MKNVPGAKMNNKTNPAPPATTLAFPSLCSFARNASTSADKLKAPTILKAVMANMNKPRRTRTTDTNHLITREPALLSKICVAWTCIVHTHSKAGRKPWCYNGLLDALRFSNG